MPSHTLRLVIDDNDADKHYADIEEWLSRIAYLLEYFSPEELMTATHAHILKAMNGDEQQSTK